MPQPVLSPRAIPDDDATLRRSEIAIALLFLITAAGAIFGAGLAEAALELRIGPDGFAAARPGLAAGAALWTVNNIGFVFIAIFAWPVLAPHAPLAALGYVATRIIESAVMMIGVMAFVTLAATPVGDAPATLLVELAEISLDKGMLPLLGFSGLFFTVPLYAHRLLPRWLAGLGVVGYVAVLAVGVGSWFGWIEPEFTTAGAFFILPVATWEIILMPIWLLWKGFNRAPQSA